MGAKWYGLECLTFATERQDSIYKGSLDSATTKRLKLDNY